MELALETSAGDASGRLGAPRRTGTVEPIDEFVATSASPVPEQGVAPGGQGAPALTSQRLRAAVASGWGVVGGRFPVGGTRHHPAPSPTARRVLAGGLVLLLALSVTVSAIPGGQGSPQAGPRWNGAMASLSGIGGSAMAKMVGVLPGSTNPSLLSKATAPPAPAPPSLATAAPLRPHEIFGFAPYWTLDQSSGFAVGGLTTLAYFGVGVNPDGYLDHSGAGWNGYQSQALADLITRAHGAGDRVVLTVSCFSQSALDALTSSPSAPATLSAAVVAAIEAKNLDGVNLDFEGSGSADQQGLTNLVTQVSSAVHAANPHYQVTMDTYASSAGDPRGFYNIPALAPAVDGFFVMAYQLNLQATASASSPLTSSMFSDLTTLKQYTAAVPPSKVILGAPFYGYDWPTTDGTLTAQATGAPSTVSYGQAAASGHPVYWDSTTDTAWTSYQVGTQWHESFFEDPGSLYLEAQLAQFFNIAGLGIWALGYDGNVPQMLGALDGFAPAAKAGAAGPATPASSTTSGPASIVPSTNPAPEPVPTDPPSATVPGPSDTAPSSTSGPVTASTGGSESTTTAPIGSGPGASLRYSGIWQGQAVVLTMLAPSQALPPGTPTYVGQLTGFQSNDPVVSCLAAETALDVWQLSGDPTVDFVMAQQPKDCATANFSFPADALNLGATTPGSSSPALSPVSFDRAPPATSSDTAPPAGT